MGWDGIKQDDKTVVVRDEIGQNRIDGRWDETELNATVGAGPEATR